MKALFIGGTGTISLEISKLAASLGIELYLLNRGNRNTLLEGVPGINYIRGDIGSKETRDLLKGQKFDVVADFIVFTKEQLLRDIDIFSGNTGQYIFISSASAYQKPLSNYLITESTPLANPYWEYSRNKIACEEALIDEYRKNAFPVTIVRPSHTYDKRGLPLAVHGRNGAWSVIKRMMDGKPVIVHGDGSSLWTVTHSRDFAKAFVGLMGNAHAMGEAVHIMSDESLTWDQIYYIIGDSLGVKPILSHIATDTLVKYDPELRGSLTGDKSNTVVFDTSKIKRLVPGFTATTRFDQGARESIGYFLGNPQAQVPDADFDAWTDKVIGNLPS